jgi:RNA polymerase sigma-70 factor (ECF subfamily)
MIKFVRFPTTCWGTIAERPDRARQELFTRYRTPVFNYILNQGYGESDADDLTQEVFLRMSREEFLRKADRSKGKFRSLVLAVARHVLWKERARRSRHPISPLGRDDLDGAPWEESPEGADLQCWNTLWVQNLVRLALDRLQAEARPDGPRYYEALMLNQIQGLSYGDVARALGARVSDIKNWIHYGKKKLKSHLLDHVKSYASGESGLRDELDLVSRFITLTR